MEPGARAHGQCATLNAFLDRTGVVTFLMG